MILNKMLGRALSETEIGKGFLFFYFNFTDTSYAFSSQSEASKTFSSVNLFKSLFFVCSSSGAFPAVIEEIELIWVSKPDN